VGVYFGNWKIYGRKYELCSIPGDKIDVLYYAFLNPTSGECKLSDDWADTQIPLSEDAICGNPKQKWDSPLKGNFYQLLELKKRFPHMKVIASIGGWTYSK
jgi:chitinase